MQRKNDQDEDDRERREREQRWMNDGDVEEADRVYQDGNVLE